MLLAVPTAIVGRQRGARWALAAAALSSAVFLAVLAWSGEGDVVTALVGVTVFVTVALASPGRVLAGAEATPATPVLAARAHGPTAATPEDLLTEREFEVLGMLATGATNAQIAVRLLVAESTAKSHVKAILHKLGVHNRTEAVSRHLRALGPG